MNRSRCVVCGVWEDTPHSRYCWDSDQQHRWRPEPGELQCDRCGMTLQWAESPALAGYLLGLLAACLADDLVAICSLLEWCQLKVSPRRTARADADAG